jgi:hypothetical protein
MAVGPVPPTYSAAYQKAVGDFSQGLAAQATPSSAGATTTNPATASSSSTYLPSAEVEKAILGSYTSTANAYASLLSSHDGAVSSPSTGFSAAIDMGTNLALAAYSNHLNGIPSSTATSAASQASTSSQSTPSPSISPTGTATSVQDAVQAAQSSALASTLSLFA